MDKLRPDDTTLREAFQNFIGDSWLRRGSFMNDKFSKTAANGWQFNADGTYWLSGLSPAAHYSTCFEAAGRFTNTNDGTGTNTYGTAGVVLTTTANANGWAKTTWDIGSSNSFLFASNPVFSASIYINTFSNNGQQIFVGVGSPTSSNGAAGITFIDASFGFKLLRESGTVNLYATNADGTTATSTLLAAVGASGDAHHLELIAKLHSDSSVDYFYRINGATISTGTTQSTNIPPSTTDAVVCSLITNNHNVAQIMTLTGISMSYQR